MPVLNHESTIAEVIQQLENEDLSIEEVLEWMKIHGKVVRVQVVPLTGWECFWIVSGIGLKGSSLILRQAILNTLNKSFAHGIIHP